MIKLSLVKEDAAPVLLTLSKATKFVAKLFWQSKHDVDVHALALNANGSIDDDAGRILSSYNTNCVLQSDGTTKIVAGTKKPFQNPLGYLCHEGDKREGLKGAEANPDEIVVINLEKMPEDIQSVVFVVSIHPPSTATFSEIRDCRVVIEDDNGTVLIDGSLTRDFDKFSTVTLGRVTRENGNWEFVPKAIGYDLDADGKPATLNTVISENNH